MVTKGHSLTDKAICFNWIIRSADKTCCVFNIVKQIVQGSLWDKIQNRGGLRKRNETISDQVWNIVSRYDNLYQIVGLDISFHINPMYLASVAEDIYPSRTSINIAYLLRKLSLNNFRVPLVYKLKSTFHFVF